MWPNPSASTDLFSLSSLTATTSWLLAIAVCLLPRSSSSVPFPVFAWTTSRTSRSRLCGSWTTKQTNPRGTLISSPQISQTLTSGTLLLISTPTSASLPLSRMVKNPPLTMSRKRGSLRNVWRQVNSLTMTRNTRHSWRSLNRRKQRTIAIRLLSFTTPLPITLQRNTVFQRAALFAPLSHREIIKQRNTRPPTSWWTTLRFPSSRRFCIFITKTAFDIFCLHLT